MTRLEDKQKVEPEDDSEGGDLQMTPNRFKRMIFLRLFKNLYKVFVYVQIQILILSFLYYVEQSISLYFV